MAPTGSPGHDPQHDENEGQHDEDHGDGQEETGDDVAEKVSHGRRKGVGPRDGDPTASTRSYFTNFSWS